MEERNYELPEQLILARQANLLCTFYKLVASLTVVALLLIAFLPGFATSEHVAEPFARNVVVLLTLGFLYYLVKKDFVLVSIFGTIGACAVIASFTIYMESPGNMQMLALIIFPTCIAGLLPLRKQFWLIYGLNILLMLFTVWMITEIKGVELEYRAVVTLGMLLTLFALLTDTMASSYRDAVKTTFYQLQEIQAAEAKLVKLDADLGLAVTERIRAENVRNRLEQTGRLALEVAGAGSIAIDLDTEQVVCSSEFFSRYGFAEAPTTLTSLSECIHEQDRSRFELLTRQDADTRDRLEGDFRVQLESPVYWMLMLETGKNADDKQSLHGIIVDVSSRLLEQQRQVAEDSKIQETQRLESLGMLAGAIAHDFNNLLHVIMLNADLARQNLNPDSKSATSIDRLLTTVDRAAELCSELLAYSGRGQFTIEPFNVEKLVIDMKNLLEISVPKGVEIEIVSDSSDPMIQGDITQIRQVVMNLITNAGEAVDNTHGHITLTVASRECDASYLSEHHFIEDIVPGMYVCITVEDNGVGMDETTSKRMFDPFYTTKETGHGLGLSAVLGIIRGHDGSIEVNSAVGEGTTTTLLLPLWETEPEIDSDDPQPDHPTSSAGTILFADDESEIRQLANLVLAGHGYKIIEAEDGQQAIDIFRDHHEELQLVILDLMMPKKTGLEAHLEISEIDSSVPVVFSSGFNENEALEKLPAKTKSRFLKKPYLAQDLRQLVEDILGPPKPGSV